MIAEFGLWNWCSWRTHHGEINAFGITRLVVFLHGFFTTHTPTTLIWLCYPASFSRGALGGARQFKRKAKRVREIFRFKEFCAYLRCWSQRNASLRRRWFLATWFYNKNFLHKKKINLYNLCSTAHDLIKPWENIYTDLYHEGSLVEMTNECSKIWFVGYLKTSPSDLMCAWYIQQCIIIHKIYHSIKNQIILVFYLRKMILSSAAVSQGDITPCQKMTANGKHDTCQ